jgi:hypothetical protein
VRVPDLCPERWLAYALGLAAYLAAVARFAVPDTQAFWGAIVLIAVALAGEAISSAWTRSARAAALPQFGIDEARALRQKDRRAGRLPEA